MPRKKKPTQTTNQLPLLSGVQVPRTQAEYMPAMPINQIKLPVEAGGENGLRRYDNQSTEALKASIKKFGFIEPIIINEDGVIIHGYHRYLVAKELEQVSVPVLIIHNWKHDIHETQFYNAYANKMNDWSSWIAEHVDSVLRKLDGGVKVEVIPGDEGTFVTAPEETGEYRDMGRILGMFIDVIPEQLVATSTNLLTLAELRVKSLGLRYQYNDEQLLYVETFRKEINRHRRRVIEQGLNDDSSNMKEKFEQEEAWDEKMAVDGRKAARIVFLHSVGLPEDMIAKKVGVPINNDAQIAKARKEGVSTFVEQVTVSNAISRSARRPFSVRDTYGWWINELFTARSNVMGDEELVGILDQLKEYRVPCEIKQDEDGPTIPATQLDLKTAKARTLREKAVNRVLELTKDLIDPEHGIPVVDKGMAEDFVDWPETLKFYASECFKSVLDEEAAKHPKLTRQKTPFDVKVKRQASNKLCSKAEFAEVTWLDCQLKNVVNTLDAVGEDMPSVDLTGVDEHGEATLFKEFRKKSDKVYDSLSSTMFNKVLIAIKGAYNQGPITLLDMMGPNRDGDMSTDPDVRRMQAEKELGERPTRKSHRKTSKDKTKAGQAATAGISDDTSSAVVDSTRDGSNGDA